MFNQVSQPFQNTSNGFGNNQQYRVGQSGNNQGYQPQYQNPHNISNFGISPAKNAYTNNYGYNQQQNNPYASDYQNNTQYDDFVEGTLKQGAQVSELELLLEGERRKHKEVREKLESELNVEKKMRVEYENKLIKIKEEFQKREMTYQQMEYKNHSLGLENQGLISENQSVRDEMFRMQELYNQKIRELDEKYVHAANSLKYQEQNFGTQMNQLKEKFNEQLQNEEQQADFRYKTLEDKCRNLLQIKTDMENEIRRLNDQFMRLKVEAEEEIREKVVRVQEEEYRKYQQALRNIEQKLKVSDEQKEKIQSKLLEANRRNQELERRFNEEYMAVASEIERYKVKEQDDRNTIDQQIALREKIKYQQDLTEQKYQRLEGEFEEFKKQSQIMINNYQKEIEQQYHSFGNEKRNLEIIRDKQANQINEKDKLVKQLQNEIERLKIEQERIANNLQNNIQRTIAQTVQNDQINFRNVDTGGRVSAYKY